MDFSKEIPQWDNTGTEPPADLKTAGWQAEYKPPAAYFNWFWNRVSACLTELREKLKAHAEVKGITTGGTGAAYTAEVEEVPALVSGANFIMLPHTVSTAVNPTLNVNGLGAKLLRRRLSDSNAATVPGSTEDWLKASKPVRVTFDGTYWIADLARPNANDIYGSVPVENGGTNAANASDARKNLEVAQAIESATHPGCYYRTVGEETEWVNPPMILGQYYRTSERINGQVVYATAISVDIDSEDSGVSLGRLVVNGVTLTPFIIEAHGVLSDGRTLPCFSASPVYLSAHTNTVSIENAPVGTTATIWAKYTISAVATTEE